MEKKSGASGAWNMNPSVSSAYPEQLIKISSNMAYGKEAYSDPEIHTVIQWHLKLCPVCTIPYLPSKFGAAATNFCPEYFEIIQEYREYEGQYAMKGNP